MSRLQLGIFAGTGLLGLGLLVFAGFSTKNAASVSTEESSGHSRELPYSEAPILSAGTGLVAVSVEGTVKNTRGEVVEGARVQALTFDGRPVLGGETLSGKGGQFRLALSPGKFSLQARREGVGVEIREPFEVPASKEPLQVEFVLQPDVQFPFQIVEDGSGLPVKGISVSISRLVRGMGSSRYSVAEGEWLSDPAGKVVFVGLSEGNYQITLSGTGYEGRTEFFQVRRGKCSRPLPWILKLRPRSYRVIFLVVDGKESSLARVRVEMKGRQPAYSDLRGRVFIDRVANGSHEAVFSLEGFEPRRVPFQLKGGECSLKLPYPVQLRSTHASQNGK